MAGRTIPPCFNTLSSVWICRSLDRSELLWNKLFIFLSEVAQLLCYIAITWFCSNGIMWGGNRSQSKICDSRSSAVLNGLLNERKQSCGKVSKEPRQVLLGLDIHSDCLGIGSFYLRKRFGVVEINLSPQQSSKNANGMLKIRNKIKNEKSVTLQHNCVFTSWVWYTERILKEVWKIS